MTTKEQEPGAGAVVFHASNPHLPTRSFVHRVSLAGHDPLDPHARLASDPVVNTEQKVCTIPQGFGVDATG